MNRVSGSMGLAKMDHKNTAALGSTLLICELLVRRRDLKFWLTSRREQKAAEAPRRRSARTEAPERHFAAKH